MSVLRLLAPLLVGVAVLLPPAAGARQPARYAVRETAGGGRVLEDTRGRLALSVAPHLGNNAHSLTVDGHEILSPGALEKQFRGIPFMGPWANRLDEQAFYANGKRFAFDMTFGNVRGERPIHGFLSWSPHWTVVESSSNATSAWITSRLEFYRHPDYMAQFPFAHTIDMTYRVSDGGVEVATRIQNVSADPMPVAVGYHPYFKLTDSPRNDWTVSLGARTEWLLSPEKLPTGETRPIETLLGDPQRIALRDFDLDHVFGDLVRDAQGRAVMSVRGKAQQIDVAFGPKYRAAVIYAPPPAAAPAQDRNFICFEPMAGITNALNLAHRGVYKELQVLAPGGVWEESFWIRPKGF
jgi:aldose 1-epimerase